MMTLKYFFIFSFLPLTIFIYLIFQNIFLIFSLFISIFSGFTSKKLVYHLFFNVSARFIQVVFASKVGNSLSTMNFEFF